MVRAIDSMEPLGSGYSIIKLNSRTFIQSIPRAFSGDQTLLLGAADPETGKIVTPSSWQVERLANNVKMLIEAGLVWVDGKTGTGNDEYYVISFIQRQ